MVKGNYGPETVRNIHQMLKNNPEYAKQYVLCYYSTSYGYDADIFKLIITGEGIYRLHVRSDYEVSLQTWSRGEHIATFSNVDDLKNFLCIHNGNAGDQDDFLILVSLYVGRK